MNRIRWLFLLLAAVFVLSSAAADSIWDRRDPRAAFLFTDSRARRVGDVLTIVVGETTTIGEKDQRNLDHQTKASGLFNFKGSTAAGKFLKRDATVSFDSSGSAVRRFDGSSQYAVAHSFLDRMAVRVMDVLPNGTLVIEGSRTRVVHGEERTLCVTGIVRPNDILLNNTVLSQSIANFKITYKGMGVETQTANQGWLSQALNYLWPF